MLLQFLHDLHHGVAEKDDRACLDDIGPSAGKHGFAGSAQGRKLIFGKFHNEEGFLLAVAGDAVNKKGADEDDGDPREVH